MMSGETASDLGVVEIHSYVRSYHIYMNIWDVQVGQELLLKHEPDNSEDSHAVAVLNEEYVCDCWPCSLQFSSCCRNVSEERSLC